MGVSGVVLLELWDDELLLGELLQAASSTPAAMATDTIRLDRLNDIPTPPRDTEYPQMVTVDGHLHTVERR
jgi:hypothetical protein